MSTSLPFAIRRFTACRTPRHVGVKARPRVQARLIGNVRPSTRSESTTAAGLGNHERLRQRTQEIYAARNRSLLLYASAVIVFTVGATYASVPLYRAFCSATGFGGIPMTGTNKFAAERLQAVAQAKRIKVHFNAQTSDTLPWSFEPQQKHVNVLPGETALAFYTAKNNGDKDIIGIATYNVTPAKIAPYFAKVECFCFEEQKLLAGEEVDMPLFFFIDKDFVDDPQMRDIDDVVLSYTFFKARRTEKGQLVPDAPEEVVEAASGFAEYELAKKKHDDTRQ